MNHDQTMQRSCIDFLDINKMMDKDQIDAFIKIQKRNILTNVKKMIDEGDDIGDIIKFVDQELAWKNAIADFYGDEIDNIFYKINKDKLEELFNYAGNKSKKCYEDIEEMIDIIR